MLSLAELLRCEDSSPLEEELAVLLDRGPDSMLGMSMLGRLLVLPGMPWLGCLDELLDGMPLLAVCGWLRLEELLLDDELDCDWDGELDEDCDGWAGGCDWVC
ncbi:hypothetical protein [Microbulbifer magnicolonia]|uniref:hypothetical protein n=1 Tax=Microbulbifer magnicolonia TaxID=3109744 RepID=UPI002B404E39|nr:hypothetical protein [Microbulbifer sp. GG15]